MGRKYRFLVSFLLFIIVSQLLLPTTSYGGNVSSSKRVTAYVEPFYIQYNGNEMLADNQLLQFDGTSYFPLVDVVRMLHGKVESSSEGIKVKITSDREPIEFSQIEKSLPKKQSPSAFIPTFSEQVQAQAVAILENDPDQVMFAKNGNQKLYPASTTKVMTALIALEEGNLSDVVTVTQAAQSVPADSSKAHLKQGDQLTLEQLLYAMMVPSGNDAAVAIAVHIAGSEKNFVKLMNEKAKELGATNTNFVNSHGYHDPNQYTTAIDLAKISCEASKKDGFYTLVSVPSYTATYKNKDGAQVTRTWRATNQQVRKDTPHFAPNMIGGKTGFTSASRHTLVSFAKEDDYEYITVILQGGPTERYVDTQRLVNRAIAERTAYDQKYKTPVTLSYTNRSLLVNGKEMNKDGRLFTYQDRLYIPLDMIEELTAELNQATLKSQTYKLALDQVIVPFISDFLQYREGRLFVPVRSIFDYYHFALHYDRETGTIQADNGEKSISMRVNSKTATVNNQPLELDTAPFIINGSTFVPVRFLANTLAETFDWGTGRTLMLQ